MHLLTRLFLSKLYSFAQTAFSPALNIRINICIKKRVYYNKSSLENILLRFNNYGIHSWAFIAIRHRHFHRLGADLPQCCSAMSLIVEAVAPMPIKIPAAPPARPSR